MAEPYVPGLDVAALTAIDVHTHAETDGCGHYSLPEELRAGADKYFGVDGGGPPTLDQLAAYYRERKMAAVVFTVDAESALGHTRIANEEVAEGARRNADVLHPLRQHRPRQGQGRRPRGAPAGRGARGARLQVPPQRPGASTRTTARPTRSTRRSRSSACPRSSTAGRPASARGCRGGGGIRLKYSNPMHLDDVAVDFPDLTIIIAHPSFPWQDEALAVATHKPHVYIDLSGWSPKYFPPQLVRYANSLLKDKVLFGSDFPLITPDRWLADFDKLDIKDEVRPLILKDNAVTALGLTDPAPRETP